MKSPFKFLDSYTKEDRSIFFGRDREIEELYHRVFESKIMLVYGISGTGKSSLIHCGLANKFQDTDWLPVVIRRGNNIVESMAAAISSVALTKQNSPANPADFRKRVRSLYLDHYKPVFFIFDQFEELFIFGNREERRTFIQIVKSLTESDLQCRMIFVMREEYMAAVTEFERFIPTFFSNRVRIEKMLHRNALEAIKGPCRLSGITLEDGFAESLLEKLSPGSEDVELTYLQVFLDKIFRLATVSNTPAGEKKDIFFELTLLQKTGNVSDLLGSFLDEQISLMEYPETAMSLLKTFISGKGTKRPASEQEATENVRSFGKTISPEEVKELIQSFVKLRVLRDRDDNGRYELRHDSLAEKIFEKLSTAEKELLEIRQMIETAYQYYLKRKILLSNDDLKYIAGKDSILDLNQELKFFIEESRALQRASRRTFKRLIIISFTAFIVLFSAIAYTIIDRSRSSNALDIATISENQYLKSSDRLSLAGYAWKEDHSNPSLRALFQSFNSALKNPENDSGLAVLSHRYSKNFSPVSSRIESASCSEDNRYIMGYTSDSVFIWNSDGSIYCKLYSGNTKIEYVRMSDNGVYVGILGTDSSLTVRDILGHFMFSKKISYQRLQADKSYRFTKENNILSLAPDLDATLTDLNGNVVQSFDHHKGKTNSLDLSDDNVFFATASSDSTIDIWYFNSDSKKYEFYNTLNPHKNAIWSVDFAPNNRYVISASADKSVKVTSINNSVVSTYRDYSVFYLSVPMGFPFSAEFDKSGTAIVVRTYTDSLMNNDQMAGIYFDNDIHTTSIGENTYFDFLTFSPDKKYFAYKIGDNISLASRKVFSVYSPINYRLMEIEGDKQFFSPDGKYIYSVCGNQIKCWFIDIDLISTIALEWYEKWHTNP
jgi:WD40 repeat protein